jgi:exodeoxyribonuclease V alpha subunit
MSVLVQLPGTANAEERTAEALLRLARAPSGLPPIRVDAAVDWAQDRAGFRFAPEQEAGLRSALTHKLAVLTGGPGTGKTSILRALVDILQAKN